ncbi:MAG: AraC family ligand binding domain-containing protein [Solibacillus sp.]
MIERSKKIGRILLTEKIDVLNIQLRAGETVAEHNVPNTVVVVVRRGEVIFNVEGVDYHLTNEDVLALDPFENHSLEAVTDVEIVVLKIH